MRLTQLRKRDEILIISPPAKAGGVFVEWLGEEFGGGGLFGEVAIKSPERLRFI